jgi:predicted PurR-regulated permease PerM
MPDEAAGRARPLGSRRGLFAAVIVLTVLAVGFTLFLAKTFLVPVAYAIVLNILLSPAVRLLSRARVPTPAGAAVITLTLIGTLALGVYELAEPVKRWTDEAPRTLSSVRGKLQRVLEPIQEVQESADQMEKATRSASGTAEPRVVVQEPGLSARIFGFTTRFTVGLFEVLVLLYFLLASGELFLQKLVHVLPNITDKKKAVRIARETEQSLSRYLVTVLFVNVIEGAVVTGAMFLLGMPTPFLWGAAVVVAEFVPYLGAIALTVVMTLSALATFDSIGHALLVPGSFILINILQAYVLSPLIVGHRLSLNPVAVVLGVMFWYWLWGIPGAFIAVPLLAAARVVFHNVDSLHPFGELLAARTPDRGRAAAGTAPAGLAPVDNQATAGRHQ